MMPTYSRDHARSESDTSTVAPLRASTSQLRAATTLFCAISWGFAGRRP